MIGQVERLCGLESPAGEPKHAVWASFAFGLLAVSYILTAFGSPIPRTYGLIELIAGIGLAAASVVFFLVCAGRGLLSKSGFCAALLLCAYLLLIPLAVGLRAGHGAKDIVRDVAPLLFLTLVPIVSCAGGGRRGRVLLLGSMLVVGLVLMLQFYCAVLQEYGSLSHLLFSTRQTYEGVVAGKPTLGPDPEKIKYFSDAKVKMYEPSVLFSAIFFLCYGLQHVLLPGRKKLPGLGALAVGAGQAYCIMAIGLRAPTGLIFLAPGMFWIALVRVDRAVLKRSLWLAPAVAAGLFFGRQAFDMMFLKQAAVGTNGKVAEWAAVIAAVREPVAGIWLGRGWGATFFNPILAGETRFTHSMLSFYLLKTGILGLLALFGAAFSLGRAQTWKLTSLDSLRVSLAAGACVLTGLFFQPSFKMLGFSIVVASALAWLSDEGLPG